MPLATTKAASVVAVCAPLMPTAQLRTPKHSRIRPQHCFSTPRAIMKRQQHRRQQRKERQRTHIYRRWRVGRGCALCGVCNDVNDRVRRRSRVRHCAHLNAIRARQLFQQIISADAAIGTYARDQAIKLMSDLMPPPAAPAPADSAPALSRRPIPVSPLNKSNDEELLQRPYSAPLDGGLKKEGSGLLHRLSDALSSLPRLHIQQLHNRLPVFRQLSPDANADDVSSQVPPPLPPRLLLLICHVPLSFRLRTATATGWAARCQARAGLGL